MARTDAVEPPASSAAAVAATGSVAPARLNRFSIRKKLPASFRLKAGLGTAATVATLCFTRLGYVQSMAADAPLSGSALLASAGGGSDLGGYNAREQCWDAGADQKEGAGWLVLYILVIIYLFVGMAVICDDYFGQCLEIIAKRLKLSDDVAGATFLAAGSSTPELFMAIAGTVYGSDVGIGTIVGSAVFNISIIIGLSAMFVPERTLPNGTKLKALQIDWRPLFRDLIFYSVAITMLLVFFAVSSPNEVEWWEALLLVLGYVAYVVFMTQSEGILLKCCGKGAAEDNDDGASDVGGPVEEDRRASDMDLVGNGVRDAPKCTNLARRRFSSRFSRRAFCMHSNLYVLFVCALIYSSRLYERRKRTLTVVAQAVKMVKKEPTTMMTSLFMCLRPAAATKFCG